MTANCDLGSKCVIGYIVFGNNSSAFLTTKGPLLFRDLNKYQFDLILKGQIPACHVHCETEYQKEPVSQGAGLRRFGGHSPPLRIGEIMGPRQLAFQLAQCSYHN